MRGLRLIPDETKIGFMGQRWLAFVVTGIIFFGSVFFLAERGLNFGVDFTGGTVVEVRVPESRDLGAMRVKLNALGLGAVSIQEFGQPDDLLIRLQDQKKPEGWQEGDPDPNARALETVQNALKEMFPEEGAAEIRRTEFVGPQVGRELKIQGLYAVLFSLAGILVYLWFRFEWQYGVAAILTTAHDVLATVGLFALTQMEFNLSTVAAVLMIAGYSINDTVIVFDRVRENLRKYKKMPMVDLLDLSVNNTLSRTLMTSGTTLLALAALYMFGGEVIRGFVNALIFGILIGTYSSIFVAAPLLIFMNVRRAQAPAAESSPQGA